MHTMYNMYSFTLFFSSKRIICLKRITAVRYWTVVINEKFFDAIISFSRKKVQTLHSKRISFRRFEIELFVIIDDDSLKL